MEEFGNVTYLLGDVFLGKIMYRMDFVGILSRMRMSAWEVQYLYEYVFWSDFNPSSRDDKRLDRIFFFFFLH